MSLPNITGIADECEKKPERHSLCGKCMTPHICAEDGPGCMPVTGEPACDQTKNKCEQRGGCFGGDCCLK